MNGTDLISLDEVEIDLLINALVLFACSGACFVARGVCKSRRDDLDVLSYATLWFAFSVSLTMYNKWFLNAWRGTGFAFPVFVTFGHMCLKAVVSRVAVNTHTFAHHKPEHKLANSNSVGIATALDVTLSNSSYLFVSVAFYTVVKSTSLIFVFVLSIMYGLIKYRHDLFASCACISIGVTLVSLGDPAFSTTGLLLVMGASAIGGLRWVLTEKMLSKENHLTSLGALYSFSPIAAATLLPLSLVIEGRFLVVSPFLSNPGIALATFGNLLASGIFALAMIFVELELIGRSSAMTLSVFGYVKQLIQIVSSVWIFGTVLTPLNVFGMVLTAAGMGAYAHLRRSRAQSLNEELEMTALAET